MFQDPLISPPCYFLILLFDTNTLFKFYQVYTLIINRFHLLILYCTFLRITILELKIWYYFIKQKTVTNSLRSHFKLFLFYSHSIVAGGLLVMSYTTRLTWATSLTMRALIVCSTSQGMRAKSLVMPSILVTARIPIV